MNYVAHLFLAEPSDEHRIGSLLADFTVGTIDSLRQKYGDGIAKGIWHHRAIDRYTDTHPMVAQATDALKAQYGIYSGIIVDVVFDHFLLLHWNRFSTMTTELFFDSVYRSLARKDWLYPTRYTRVVDRMLEKRWLHSYIHIDNVGFALKKIGERFSHATPLGEALEGILSNYNLLNDRFLSFFPELVKFSQDAVIPESVKSKSNP